MLKRIAVHEVELGMFIQKLEGSWFKHPFWRTKFVLSDQETLDQLRASDVEGVIIDVAKGKDVAKKPEPVAAPTPVASFGRSKPSVASRIARSEAPGRAAAPRDFDLRSTRPTDTATEFHNAGRVAERSQKIISKVFLEARLGKAISAVAIEPVVDDIYASVQRNPFAFNGLMRCKRDMQPVYRHALAVSALMIALGQKLRFKPEDLRMVGMAGLLLDVGIGHLPVDLAEFGGDFRRIDPQIFNAHVQLGHDQLVAGGIPTPVAQACLEHHERLNGSGYPRRLSGDQISVFGRIAAICDTYDWLIDDIDGSSRIDPAQALQHLIRSSDEYDPDLVHKLGDVIGVYPIGSVVELASGRLAVVVAQDETDVARPVVRTFFSVQERRVVQPVDVALARCYGEDKIVGSVDPVEKGCVNFLEIYDRLLLGRKPAAAKAAPSSQVA